MTSVSDPLIGQVLDGRYEVLSRLARGGMATVYRGLDQRLTRTVAIKVMHEGLGGDTDFVSKFDREARAAATLSNPHVVSVFDQGIDRGRPYIVMEFVDGCTLRHVLNREAPMEPLRALDVMESVVHALASAHDAHMVHRDVKPENVLISSRGQVKVADFGLARAVTAQTATATQGLLMGTVSYMPPELVTQARANATGDVYSAGIVLFEMLTGQKPHVADTPIAVAWSHVHNDIPAPSTLLASSTDSARIVPPYLDALVVACTRRQSADRPRDARELLALVRTARRALRKGVMDDSALTAQMLASTRPDTHLSERTVPDPDARPDGYPARPVSHRPVSPHSGPIGSSTTDRRSTDALGAGLQRRQAPTPQSPAERADTDANVFGPRATAVPAPRSARSLASPRTPRSPRTPVFTNISQAPEHKRRRGLVAVALVLILVALMTIFGYLYTTRWTWATSPALASLREAEAVTLAQADGFSVITDQQFSETVAKGTVISVSPAAGERVKQGAQLLLVVSAGPERYPAPKVVGLPLDQARTSLTQAKLSVGKVTEVWHESAEAGMVLSASQSPGTQLKANTPINLTVSKGPQPIPIPSWVGQNAADAKATLTKAGFEVDSSEQNSDSVAKGLVISQTPSRGQGKKGDTISLVVSKGPVLVEVPRVTGKDEAAARTRLTSAGFKVTVTYNTPSWLRLNVVAGQDPGVGKAIPKGSTITIFVS